MESPLQALLDQASSNRFRVQSPLRKRIMGDDGECKTLILHNAKADLTVEVIPTSRAAFAALGAMATIGGTGKRR